jgi:hypothetical protein
MRSMRKLETQNIAPKCERTFEIRNGDAGVIGRYDPEFVSAHVMLVLVNVIAIMVPEQTLLTTVTQLGEISAEQ